VAAAAGWGRKKKREEVEVKKGGLRLGDDVTCGGGYSQRRDKNI
jgi:hypothetical protein